MTGWHTQAAGPGEDAPAPIWRVSFIGLLGEPAVVAEGPEPTVREAVQPFLQARMQDGFTLADLVPWLDWEIVGQPT